jgi:prevent-host-death family protein
MREISVTHFKNQALKLLDEVSRTGRRLILTRHGKPLVLVEPARNSEKVV